MMDGAREDDELRSWVAEGYPAAYRTACLILGNRADAEEALQEAYLRAWRFRASLPTGEGARPWLYRVLVNACVSKGRAEGRHRGRAAGPDGLDDRPAPDVPPETSAERDDTARRVARALADLPEHLRVPVVLRYWTGLSEREIATAIARRPGTVKSRLHEARRRLAEDPTLGALAPDIAEGGTR